MPALVSCLTSTVRFHRLPLPRVGAHASGGTPKRDDVGLSFSDLTVSRVNSFSQHLGDEHLGFSQSLCILIDNCVPPRPQMAYT